LPIISFSILSGCQVSLDISLAKSPQFSPSDLESGQFTNFCPEPNRSARNTQPISNMMNVQKLLHSGGLMLPGILDKLHGFAEVAHLHDSQLSRQGSPVRCRPRPPIYMMDNLNVSAEARTHYPQALDYPGS
jgi:hypothetical protein